MITSDLSGNCLGDEGDWTIQTSLSRDFHFAVLAATVYCLFPRLRSFSAFIPEPNNRTRPAEPLPEPKQSHPRLVLEFEFRAAVS
jgi:hypothetical protein